MKQTVQMDEIQRKMQPGVITLSGFMGNDERKLIDILTEDNAEIQRLGYSNTAMADRMNQLRNDGMKGLGDFISVPPHFEVRVDSVRGKLPCPFGDPGIFPKTNITVKNVELNREIIYTDLNIHMISAHGFYQGKGSLFRLEPKELIHVLEIPRPDDRAEMFADS